jgi:hypothetical protein
MKSKYRPEKSGAAGALEAAQSVMPLLLLIIAKKISTMLKVLSNLTSHHPLIIVINSISPLNSAF